MLGRKISTYLIALLLLLSCPLLISSTADAAWAPSATLTESPEGTVYQGQSVDLTYELQIASISRATSVRISSFEHRLDWESSAMELVSSPITIELPGSYTFHRTVMIPQSASDGQHSASISITGKASRDLFSSTHTWKHEITVESRPELELSISGSPSGGAAPLDVAFTSTVNGGTPPFTYAWTFGDGQTGNEADPHHRYESAGSFTVSLTVRDAQGATAEDDFEVKAHIPLQVSASSDIQTGTAPLTVRFSCSPTGGSPTYSYLWNFGDGNTSSEANPSHEYSKAGTYQVFLVVTDSESRQKTYQDTITVKEVANSGGFLIFGVVIAIVAMTLAYVQILQRRKRVNPPNQRRE